MYRFDLFTQKKNYTLSAKNRRESFPRPAVATFASNLTSDSNFPCQILYVPLSYLFEDCISAEGKWLKLNSLPRKHPTSAKVKNILISCPSHAICLITRTSGTCAASSEQAPQVRTFEHLGAPWGTFEHLRPASWAGATVRATAKHQQSAANGLPEKTCESGVLQDISFLVSSIF